PNDQAGREPATPLAAPSASERAADGGRQPCPDHYQRERHCCSSVERQPALRRPGSRKPDRGEQRAPNSVTEDSSVLEAADRTAFARGASSRVTLHRRGVHPAKLLKAPAAKHGDEKPDRTGQPETQLPGSAGQDERRCDGGGSVVGVPGGADRQDVEREEL